MGLRKPSAGSLSVRARLSHHIICKCILPREGHRNEVSYYEVFLIDSILGEHKLHLGYILVRHLIQCIQGRVLVTHFGRVFTPIFMYMGIDLILEDDVQRPTHYDTFNASTLACMKIAKGPSVNRTAQIEDQHEEEEIRDMEASVNPQDHMEDDLDIPS